MSFKFCILALQAINFYIDAGALLLKLYIGRLKLYPESPLNRTIQPNTKQNASSTRITMFGINMFLVFIICFAIYKSGSKITDLFVFLYLTTDCPLSVKFENGLNSLFAQSYDENRLTPANLSWFFMCS